MTDGAGPGETPKRITYQPSKPVLVTKEVGAVKAALLTDSSRTGPVQALLKMLTEAFGHCR